MFSVRFQRQIYFTRHARLRMLERNMSEELVHSVIDNGTLKYKDATHLWLYKFVAGRDDNLLCAAVVLGDALVIKTVMHHFDVWE